MSEASENSVNMGLSPLVIDWELKGPEWFFGEGVDKTKPGTVSPRIFFIHGEANDFVREAPISGVSIKPIKGPDFVTFETVHSLGNSTYQRVSDGQTFVNNLGSIGRERDVLRHAVSSLWRMYRFNQNYVGFLSGGVTEEDFNGVIQGLAVDPVKMSLGEIKEAAQFILPLIADNELTPQELASVLNVEEGQLKLAL